MFCLACLQNSWFCIMNEMISSAGARKSNVLFIVKFTTAFFEPLWYQSSHLFQRFLVSYSNYSRLEKRIEINDRLQILFLISIFKQIDWIASLWNNQVFWWFQGGNKSWLVHLNLLNIRKKIWQWYLNVNTAKEWISHFIPSSKCN